MNVIFFNNELAEKILSMPECSHGVNRLRVYLCDGRQIDGVYVAWGREIIRVEGFSAVPFDAEDVVNVENDM